MESARKIWEDLQYYIRHWLIWYEKNTRYSKYKIQDETNSNTCLEHNEHKMSIYQTWEIIDCNRT